MMILYQLKCSTGHEFEAWFRDGAAYDAQSSDGQVNCPFCGDNVVSKAPMAPHVGKGSAERAKAESRAKEVAEQVLQSVNELKDHVEENCEDVGDKFAEEARRIHYGESEERGIYGQATDEEATELNEEGVEFYRLPHSTRRDEN